MRVNLIGGDKKGLSVAIESQENLNCYAIPRTDGLALVGTMGTTSFSTVAGLARGSIKMDGTLYAVFGTTLYSINSAGTATSLGAVSGSGRVSMATDQANIVIVTGYGNAGYVYNGTTLATISDSDFPGADTVNFTGNYFTFAHPGGWFISEVGSATNYNALDFVGRSGETDIVGQATDHGEVINFHSDRIKIWVNTGNSDFPFELNGAAQIERGLYAKNSIASDDNTVFFLGNDLMVYRLDGYTPVKISDEGLDVHLSNYVKDGYASDVSSAWGYTYTDHGHKFYVLTIPNRGTHVINIATGLSHKLRHWDYETHHSHGYQNCYGKHLICGINGNVYEMSRDYYEDHGGKVLLRLRRAAVISVDDRLIRYKSIKFIFDTGNGLATGQGSDPVVMVRWYDDDGRVPRVERHLSVGAMGQYRKSVKTTGCGSARRRVIEISQSDPVPFVLIDAYAEVA